MTTVVDYGDLLVSKAFLTSESRRLKNSSALRFRMLRWLNESELEET